MSSNVIIAVSSALVKRGIASLRFNFRGVGRSQGKFGGGIEEQQDIIAALDWLVLQAEVDIMKIGLAGYSFGAVVASPVAVKDKRIKALALISPPFSQAEVAQLKNYTKPKLIICGSDDFIVSVPAVMSWAKELIEPKQLELVSGADHLWWGYETEMAEKVSAFFLSVMAGQSRCQA